MLSQRTHRTVAFLTACLWSFNLWAAPSTTLSIDPSASAGSTITAADENDRNNDVTTWANAHDHNDVDQLSNTVNLGDGTAGNKTLCGDAADSSDRCLRWDDTTDSWVLQQPSTTYNPILTASGPTGLVQNRVAWGDGVTVVTTVPSVGLIDLSGIDASTTTEGLILPQATSCTSATAEGQACWDSNNDFLSVGDGTAAGGVARFFSGSATRDTSVSSGTQAITGVGFTPKAVLFFVAQSGADELSVGLDDGTTNNSFYDANDTVAGTWNTSGNAIHDRETATAEYTGVLSSMDTDGFTITWTRTGSPTGTLDITYLAMR